jgi:hypothetical protein
MGFSTAGGRGGRGGSGGEQSFHDAWLADNFPRMFVVDKIHIYVGDMDTYQLDRGVLLMDEWMKTITNPHYTGFFMYGDRKPHCWSGPQTQAEKIKEMAMYVQRHAPAGTTTPWWKY